MRLITLILFIYVNTIANCIDYKKVKNIYEKIHAGMAEKDLYAVMNKYGWKEKKLGSDGLKLSTYKRVLNEKGESVLQYAPKGYKRLIFKPSVSINSIVSIEVELSDKPKMVSKKNISKSIVTLNEYERIYEGLPLFPEKIKHIIKSETENSEIVKNRGECNGKAITYIEQNQSNNPISVDSLITITYPYMTDQEFLCTIVLNGWVWGRIKDEYYTTDTINDPCGDTIEINIPVADYYFYSKKNDFEKIRAVIKDYKYVKLISKIEVLKIGGEKAQVWSYFDW